MGCTLPLHGVSEPRPDFATLSEMYAHAVATAPDTVAAIHGEATVTYEQEARAVAALARRIARVVRPGETLALLLPNSIEFRVGYFGAVKALAAPALLNPLYPAPQLEKLLDVGAPRAAICVKSNAETLRGLAARRGMEVFCFGEDVSLANLMAEPDAPLDRRAAKPDDVAAMLFTGGTTGLSKGVEQTHERLVIATRCADYSWPLRATGEVFLPIAPFTHVFGFLQGVLAPVFSRATVVIPERFQPELAVDLLSKHHVTVFGGGPPAIYAGLLAAPNLKNADLSALRVCPAGGAPMPVELLQRWKDATGCEIHEGYGMTEMAPISGTTDLTGVRPGSVGKAIPCNTIQTVDLETGARVLDPGERGEVRVRGPHMMRGYRDNPDETAQTLRDGFIHTGDIGHLDEDGFLFITDRKKDVVLVKGFNVFPREVEEAIHAHPKVAGVGVVGAPDPRSGGEKLIAFVVPRPSETLAPAEVAAHCASRLVNYQCPAEIRIVDRLPVTGAQKLDRLALRRALEEASRP